MAYVSPNCPLPRNSTNPVTSCEAARAKKVVQNLEGLVNQGYRASQKIAGPESFAVFGAPVVRTVQQSQQQMGAARQMTAPKPATAADAWQEVRRAPRVLPLNVSVAEYESCCDRGTDSLQPVIAQPPQLIMPPAAPPVDLVRQDGRPSVPALPVKYMGIVAGPGQQVQVQSAGTQYDAIVNRGMGGIWGDAGLRCPQVRYQAGVNWKAAAILGAAILGLFAVTRS